MSGPRRLAAVPSRREQQILDWLGESQAAPSRDLLEVAFAQLPRVRQRRAWPWARLEERLRPEPFGSHQARLVALAVAATLLLMLFAGTVVTVGQRAFANRDSGPPGVTVVSPGPTDAPSPSVTAVFPLVDPLYELVIGESSHRQFTIRSDGTNRRPVGEDITAALVSPEWGPDGSVLVQESTSTSEQIWRADPAGLRRSVVIVPCVEPCGSRNEASWSHDGRKIALFQAFGRPVNGLPITCGIGLYDAASLAINPVTSSPCAVIEERQPRFSPDDRSIAFWRSRSPNRIPMDQIEDSALFTRDLETGVEAQVTDWSTHASMLDWSPDGDWIAFVPDVYDPAAPDADVWRVHPDGSGLERMTTLDTAAVQILRPRYTPDGAWILFTRVGPNDGELLAIPADGGEPLAVLPGTTVRDFDVRAAD